MARTTKDKTPETKKKKAVPKKVAAKKRVPEKASSLKKLLETPAAPTIKQEYHLAMPTQAEREALREAHKWPWPLRPYQQKAYDAFEAGKRRQGLFWHRRAGKDIFGLSMARNESIKRVGGYVHFFPKHIQAKRAIWNGIDPKKGAR